MGEWFWREADQHKCDYPKYALPSGAVVGDVWECDCKKKWRLSETTLHRGDPRDQREHDYYTGKFTQIIEHDGRGRD